MSRTPLSICRSIADATTAAGTVLPEWAEDKAREIARGKGWDDHVLSANWMDFFHEATAKGSRPKNAGAAFVAYCKKQGSLRHVKLYRIYA